MTETLGPVVRGRSYLFARIGVSQGVYGFRFSGAMRILWLSDSPAVPSGFGNVTAFVCEGLARLGYDVHILGWQATEPSKPWKGATLHGAGWHPLGADVLLSHLYRLRPDVLITLADVWWLTFLTDPSLRQFFEMTSTRWLSYFPIDGHRPDGTLPPSWVEMLRRADAPVAMSRYGLRMTQASGVTCEYIPHGVDASNFSPDKDLQQAKRRLGYEGRFVILSDARNQPRKMLPRLLTIFERFARDKPDALLHLHCDPNDPAAEVSRYSYRIDADVRALGLSGRVRFTPGFGIRHGLPLADLVNVYRAADLHLLVSTGEGFGLPTLQAAACGVVPIAPDYSANPELVEGHGATIRVRQFVPDEFGIARAFVDVDDAVACLEAFYRDRTQLRASSLRARQFAESYDWSKVLPQWDAVLRRCAGPRSTARRNGAPSIQTVAISHLASRPAW
ncbi:MAG: glycosyltransferase family 4 protein, partial [Chloroflexi bacterium]